VGTVSSVHEKSLSSSQKGEFTLVIAPRDFVL
jgi:hypothetical protein